MHKAAAQDLWSVIHYGMRRLSGASSAHDADQHRPILDPDIEALDLSYASYYLVAKEDWRLEKALRAEQEFRLMLQLYRYNPEEQIVPTRLGDLFWHAALKCNEIYNAQCMRLFNHVLHHDPFAGMRSEQDARDQVLRFQRSRRLQAVIERGVVPPPKESKP